MLEVSRLYVTSPRLAALHPCKELESLAGWDKPLAPPQHESAWRKPFSQAVTRCAKLPRVGGVNLLMLFRQWGSHPSTFRNWRIFCSGVCTSRDGDPNSHLLR